MKLSYHKSGTGQPLVILHGLYGSSDNWHTIGRILSASFEVYLVDQRNHGRSPHHPEHTYEALREDLYEFFITHHINNAVLLGHSMGGKTAMSFAFKYGQLLNKLVIVDISPLGYNTDSANDVSVLSRIIGALQQTDPAAITSRDEADKLLATAIHSKQIRQFLLKNLKRTNHGKFVWTLNTEALANNLKNIMAGVAPEKNAPPSDIDTQFIKGEKSGYVNVDDIAAIKSLFNKVSIVSIPGAGHWVHAEQQTLFINAICSFLGCKKAS